MVDVITSFRLEIPQAEIDDLQERLARTRWPERETVPDWSQGIPLEYLQELCAYWRSAYDWRRCEARLNATPQFRTEIDGLGIHYLHARSPHTNALPLLLTHGWPGSVGEFLKVIGPLVDPPAYGGDASDASTSFARRFRATASVTSPPSPAGAPGGSPPRGRS